MLMTDLIVKKRDKQKLSAEEIKFMIDGYTCGNIPDYQMSAMLMAIPEENSAFTTIHTAVSSL